MNARNKIGRPNAVQKTTMGKDVQRISIGYERSSRGTRLGKFSLKQWFGRRLEQYGKRLLRASVNP